MTDTDNQKAVLRMQDYITKNIEEEISIDDICAVSGYLKRHALRIFKEFLHKTPFEYIRDCRLTRAAKELIDTSNNNRILDIALDAGFKSHEGFTKAFINYYGISPNKFYRHDFPKSFIKPTPISYYYLLLRSKGMNDMSRTVTATYITKPACKLIIKRGIISTDYFSYCDEIGCDIWDELEKISNRLDKVSFVTLPETMVKERTSNVGTAAEVPLDFNEPIPSGCDIIELPEQLMICFQGQPYEEENWYGGAHSELYNAMENYNPELYGYIFAYDVFPQFQYPASPNDGVKALKPVLKLNQ